MFGITQPTERAAELRHHKALNISLSADLPGRGWEQASSGSGSPALWIPAGCDCHPSLHPGLLPSLPPSILASFHPCLPPFPRGAAGPPCGGCRDVQECAGCASGASGQEPASTGCSSQRGEIDSMNCMPKYIYAYIYKIHRYTHNLYSYTHMDVFMCVYIGTYICACVYDAYNACMYSICLCMCMYRISHVCPSWAL